MTQTTEGRTPAQLSSRVLRRHLGSFAHARAHPPDVQRIAALRGAEKENLTRRQLTPKTYETFQGARCDKASGSPSRTSAKC